MTTFSPATPTNESVADVMRWNACDDWLEAATNDWSIGRMCNWLLGEADEYVTYWGENPGITITDHRGFTVAVRNYMLGQCVAYAYALEMGA